MCSNNVDSVGLVIVVYNPDVRSLSVNIDRCRHQFDKVVVVDNSSFASLDSIFVDYHQIDYIPLYSNAGIAAAQNIAIKKLINAGVQYIVELDQDTELPADYIDRIKCIYSELKNKNIFGIGPATSNHPTNSIGMDAVHVQYTLSSGFFYCVDVVNLVGFKDEGLFIDLVDWEWCFRAANVGLKTFMTQKIVIKHEFGDGSIPFLSMNLGVSKPFRNYYQIRNIIFLLKKDYIPFQWKLINIFKLIFKFLFYPLLQDYGFQRFMFMSKGIVDGCCSRGGPLK